MLLASYCLLLATRDGQRVVSSKHGNGDGADGGSHEGLSDLVAVAVIALAIAAAQAAVLPTVDREANTHTHVCAVLHSC